MGLEHGQSIRELIGGKGMIYRTCPLCGANLDPGESCDCKADKRNMAKERRTHYETAESYTNELPRNQEPHP